MPAFGIMENKTEDDGGVADPPADMDADADDSDFVEVDPTGRYGRVSCEAFGRSELRVALLSSYGATVR